MEMGWQDLWESVEEMVIDEIPARKKFVKILNQMADIVFQNRVLYEFLFTAPRNTNIPDSKASWKVFQNRTYATLQSIVDEGMDQGDFADIKPESVQLLLETIEPKNGIDNKRAEGALNRAQKRIKDTKSYQLYMVKPFGCVVARKISKKAFKKYFIVCKETCSKAFF